MTLNINPREIDGITILDLDGRITLADGSITLRNAVRGLHDQNKKNIVLNISDVTYIDSSGVGELVAACTTTRNVGGNLKLLRMNERPATDQPTTTLKMTMLYAIFQHFDNEAEGVASFRSERGPSLPRGNRPQVKEAAQNKK